MMGSLYTFPRDYHEGDGSQNWVSLASISLLT
jgi:hypothetical protein